MRVFILSAIVAAAWAAGSQADEMPALSKKYECDGCHAINHRVVGPSWMEISRKYKGVARYSYGGREYPLEEGLVMKVSMGGGGNWGTMPMPPNDPKGKYRADMQTLVRYVLGLAK